MYFTIKTLIYFKKQKTVVVFTASKLFVIGGVANGTISLNTGESLNYIQTSSNTSRNWTVIAPMTVTRGFAAGALLPDGITILVVGGNTGGNIDSSCELYNTTHNTWSSCPSLPRGSRQAHSAVVYRGRVVVLGGYNGVYLETCEQYEHAYRTWTDFPPFNLAREKFGSAVVRGKIYIAGVREHKRLIL